MKAASNDYRTERVAPDGKVYVGHKLGNTLNTQLDFSIRRYPRSVL